EVAKERVQERGRRRRRLVLGFRHLSAETHMPQPVNVFLISSQNLRLLENTQSQPAPATSAQPVSFQRGWGCCQSCAGLVYSGFPDPGACAAGGKHATGASASYAIQFGQGGAGMQARWRWCRKCQGMVFAGNPDPGACPTGGKHDTA